MTPDQKFYVFLESLKNDTNVHLIDSIKEGYDVCMEAGMLRKVGKVVAPFAVAAGLMAGTGVGESDIELERQAYEQTKWSTQELSKIVTNHEAAIKSGNPTERANAYSKVKEAGLRIGYDKDSGVKYYWDTNLGRAFYPDGSEVPSEERPYLPDLYK